jgi:UDP-N-acetylmuramyl tripeptide synthase
LLAHLTAGRNVALVSGTNGKTTTTALLVAALKHSGYFVATNDTGANMPPGHVAAVSRGERFGPVVLETDEAYIPKVLGETSPKVVVLLNLSRDQLDRTSEVRMLAERWREALSSFQGAVVANADDPLVVFATEQAPNVIWVGAGSAWTLDAVGCPLCDGQLHHDEGDWRCSTCMFRRPSVAVALVGEGNEFSVDLKGTVHSGVLALPGAFNRANAAMALTAAEVLGCDPKMAMEGLGTVSSVAGRYGTSTLFGRKVQLLLAKNPAGWSALLDLVKAESCSLTLALNARVADGFDPSWIWDVDFEQLSGRKVVVTGDRRFDLAVRLHYAGLKVFVVDSLEAAIAAPPEGPMTFIGNYTAFREANDQVLS